MKNYKKIISLLCVLLMFSSFMPATILGEKIGFSAVAQANGFIAPIDNTVPPGAIIITTAAQLAEIGGVQSAGKYYVLGNDINLVTEWVPINDFRGTFDGRGHVINNLYILESSNREYAGLFGEIKASSVVIKNLGVNIYSKGINVSSVFIESSPSGIFVGGLIGFSLNNNIVLENCYVKGEFL